MADVELRDLVHAHIIEHAQALVGGILSEHCRQYPATPVETLVQQANAGQVEFLLTFRWPHGPFTLQKVVAGQVQPFVEFHFRDGRSQH